MKYIVSMNGKKYEVEVERVSPFHMLTREEVASGVSTPVQPVAPVAAPAPAPVAAPAPKAAPAPAPAAPAAPAAPIAGGAATVNSPMPGSVLKVLGNVGDAVKAGQTLFVIEAMKMENEIVAPADGTIAEILVKTGDVLDTDQVMATLK